MTHNNPYESLTNTHTHTPHHTQQTQENVQNKPVTVDNIPIITPRLHYDYECRQQDERPPKRLKLGCTITDLVQKGMNSTTEYKAEKKRTYVQLALEKDKLISEQEKSPLFGDEKDEELYH